MVQLAPPRGLRDFIPPEAGARRALIGRLLHCVSAHGYQLVTLPLVEQESVLLRGLADVSPHELIRFVDAESGEVAALRPDITPQIARLVATVLADRPAPYRLSYEGTVFRQRKLRARQQRQTAQVGVECVGVPGVAGDEEVIRLALEATNAVGVAAAVELSCPRLARAPLSQLPETERAVAEEALQRKDVAELARVLRGSTLPLPTQAALLRLPELYGPARDILAGFDAAPLGTEAVAQLDALRSLADRLLAPAPAPGSRSAAKSRAATQFASELLVDLGAVRGRRYYTGIRFQLLARGLGEPVGRGGRYDALLGAYGMPLCATGFALMVDPLAEVLSARRAETHAPAGASPSLAERDHAALAAQSLSPGELETLRQGGLSVALVDSGDLAAYCAAWDLAGWIVGDGDTLRATVDGITHTLARDALNDLKDLLVRK